MKKILLLLICLGSVAAQGQTGFFVQPLVGIGLSNFKHSGPADTKNVLVYDAGAEIGYQGKNFVLSTGIGYLETGCTVNMYYTDPLGNPISTEHYYNYFNHLIIPVTVGHEFRAGKKLSVLPTIGTLISFNISGRETVPNYPGSPKIEPVPNDRFRDGYNTLSLFGVVQVNFDYKVTPRFYITMGPAVDYMFTNMLKAQPGAPVTPRQNNYAFLFNAGVKWYFEKPRQAKQ